jgi:zinc protease
LIETGRTRITHRRITSIAAVCLSLLVIPAAAIHAQKSPEKSAAAMPTVEEILNNYEQAIGGRAAWQSLVSLQESGSVQIPGNDATGMYENYYGGGTKYYGVVKLTNGIVGTVGFDGEVGWSVNPQVGLRRLFKNELIEVRRMSRFPEQIHFREFFDQIELKGKTEIGSREAYVLEATSVEGAPWTLYFDAHNWLRLRVDITQPGPRGIEQAQDYFEDYRQVDGLNIKYPYREVEKTPSFTLIITVKDLRFNQPFDESVFKAPSFRATVQQ